jgi:hypothetical protein
MNAPDERYLENVVVAAIDILGISQMVSQPGGTKKAAAALATLAANATSNKLYRQPGSKEITARSLRSRVGLMPYRAFSDSGSGDSNLWEFDSPRPRSRSSQGCGSFGFR